MFKKLIFIFTITLAFLVSIPFRLFAEIPSPVFPDGISQFECDVAWNKDLNEKGEAISEGLRHRIELYNQAGNRSVCQRRIFFLFRDETILIQKPLVLQKNIQDRGNGIFAGTFISGYGTLGTTEKLNITIDALELTKNKTSCAFVIHGGFSAKQQIKGLKIQVRSASQAVCDENGNDLLTASSPNCPGKTGKECEFSDLTILVSEPPAESPTPAPASTPTPESPSSTPKNPDSLGTPSSSTSPDAENSSGCQIGKTNSLFSFYSLIPILFNLAIFSLWRFIFYRRKNSEMI